VTKNGVDTLSAADGAWWRMEHPTNPMTITAVFTFVEPLGYEELQQLIERKLLRYGRFRQRIVGSGRRGGARWEEDPDFTLRNHLRRVNLPEPADQGALQGLVGELMSTPLPADRPPWQIHHIPTYRDGSAMVVRIHHCIGDGMSLVRVLLGMADEPVAGAAASAHKTFTGAGAPSTRALVSPARFLAAARTGGGAAATVGRLLAMRADPRTVFRGALGTTKRAAWSRPIPLDDVKRIGRRLGGTVNDVLLSAVAGALRAYLARRGARADGLTLRAVVPVNLRRPDDLDSLGNKFGLVFLPLPVGEPDPLARLRATKRNMDRIKRSPEAVVVFGLLRALGKTTPALLVRAVNMLGRKATAVITNVPGPYEPIRFCGKVIESVMFWVPQSGRLGLGISILSYAGQVRIGVASDAGLVPDPESIAAAFHDALDELLPAASASRDAVHAHSAT
jgi:diacylglycerol O-acyltransferase